MRHHPTQYELLALERLNELIDVGVEYPEAQYRVSQEFKQVKFEVLQELYDEQP